MPGLQFTITVDQITPTLRRLGSPQTTQRVLRAAGDTLKSIVEGMFHSTGARFRPITWKEKYDKSPSNLKLTTRLSKSFRLTVSSQSATVATDVPYAAIHQTGGTIVAHGKALRFRTPDGRWVFVKKVVLPPRPFFPILPTGDLVPAAAQLIEASTSRILEKISEGK